MQKAQKNIVFGNNFREFSYSSEKMVKKYNYFNPFPVSGLLFVTCLYNDVALASEPAESSDMSVTESNGLAALEIKIEAEQVQDENSVLLKRIINLADDILAEAVDAIGELSPAGMQVKIHFFFFKLIIFRFETA